MLQIAEKILRKRPKVVTFLAPLCTFTLTILCGTGHTVYTLLPIIYDVAIKPMPENKPRNIPPRGAEMKRNAISRANWNQK